MAWGSFYDFRSKRTVAAGLAEPHRRPPAASREMVGGLVSHALYTAVKARAATDGKPVYKLLAEMDLGHSTWRRMLDARPIAQATALKIVSSLGTSVRAVLSKYQQDKKP